MKCVCEQKKILFFSRCDSQLQSRHGSLEDGLQGVVQCVETWATETHVTFRALLLWLLVAMEICAKLTCWSPRKYLSAIALLPWLLITMETCYINMLVTREISSSQCSAGCHGDVLAALAVGHHGNIFHPGLCWLPWKRLPARALLVAMETSSSQGSAGCLGNILQLRLCWSPRKHLPATALLP